MFKGLKMMAVAAAAVLMSAGAVHAENVQIQGAGATFPAPLYAKWVAAYNAANADTKVDYQAIGSGGGIKAITDRTAQFAGSDAPMSDVQEKAAPAKLLHVPMVAGPEVMIYNLPALKEKLKLDSDTIAKIYLGEITTWNDAKIKALNPGVELPADDIIVVHRSDGSGTTFIFTDFLSKVSDKWKSTVGSATSVKWPLGLGGKGNDGVAAAVANAEGTIGYVEFAFAKKKGLVYAAQINKSGNVVEPSIDNINNAASSIAQFPADMKVSITNTDGTSAYPICGYTYLLVYQDLSYLPKPQAQAVVNYVNWCIHDGQALAKDLGYAKLAPDLQKKVEDEIKTIAYNGEPLLK
jgi:phosphate transport system substrate-binding protein